MKKSIKILSLVLAIALICGAFIVGAFAASVTEFEAGTGEKVVAALDFESESWIGFNKVSGTDGTTSANNAPADAGLSLLVVGRHGTFEIAKDVNDNHYALYTDNAVQAANSGAYFETSRANRKETFETHPISVIDFDVYFPNGAAPNNWTLQSYYKGWKSESAYEWISTPLQTYAYLTGSSDCTIKVNGSNTSVQLSASAWSHITVIVEARHIWVNASGTEVAEGTEGAIAAAKLIHHLAVNGVIVDSVEYNNTLTLCAGVELKDNNTRNLSPTSAIWLAFGSSSSTGNQIAVDNMIFRQYSKESDDYAFISAAAQAGKGTNLTSWADNLYNEDKMPLGTPVAKIGDTLYDDLQKAVKAAAPGATIDLLASIPNEITVNKALTINKNGFTVGGFVAEGQIEKSETDTAYVFQVTNLFATIVIEECPCGNNCFGAEEGYAYATLTAGTPIISGLKNALGELKCEYQVGKTIKVLTGFTVTAQADETSPILADVTEISLDSTVAIPELTTGFEGLLLAPKYDTFTITVQVLDATGAVIKEYYEGASLKAIFTEAPANSTVQLLADYYPTANDVQMTTADKVTFDLNGFSFVGVYTAASKYNKIWINAGSNETITFTSSKVGGKIFSACYTGTKYLGSDSFVQIASGATINFNGKDAEGNTSLAFYGSSVVNGYGTAKHNAFNIDGGEYYMTIADGWATGIWLSNFNSASIKDAYLYGSVNVFSFLGQGLTTQATVTIDNCVLEGSITTVGNANTLVNVTNSYINGTLKPTALGGADTWQSAMVQPTGAEWTLGNGCYISQTSDIDSAVQYASEPSGISKVVEHTTHKNVYGSDKAAGLNPVEATTAVTYVQYVAPSISVEWIYNGKSLGTSKAIPGMGASSPVIGSVEGTKGLVEYKVATFLPENAEDGYQITIDDSMEKIYTVGKVPAQFNLALASNFTFNFYVPEVEGVTYGKATITYSDGASGENKDREFAFDYIDAEGEKWGRTNIYPGGINADARFTVTIPFTYNGIAMSYTTAPYSVAEYASYLIDRDVAGTALKNVMADCVRYIYFANIMAGSTPGTKFMEIYNSDVIQNNLSTMPSIEGATNAALDETDMSTYIEDVSVLSGTASYAGVATVSVKAKDGYHIRINKTQTVKDGNVYVLHAARNNTLNDEITIEVFDGDVTTGSWKNITGYTGNVIATYTWSYAGYINDYRDVLDAQENALEFAEAVYSYAVSCDKYIAWKNLCRS